MKGGGLSDARAETVNHGVEVQSADHPWDSLTSAARPIGIMAGNLPGEHPAGTGDLSKEMLQERSAHICAGGKPEEQAGADPGPCQQIVRGAVRLSRHLTMARETAAMLECGVASCLPGISLLG